MFNYTIDYPFLNMADLYGDINITKGDWTVSTIEIKNDDYRNIMDHYILPHKYIALTCNKPMNHNMYGESNVMMSDTPMERYTNQEILNNAKGNILIAGLGIGMLPAALAQKEDVKSITIIEYNQDIIDIVSELIKKNVPNADKIHVIKGDAWEFPKTYTGPKFDWFYADIWANFPNEERDYDMFEEMFSLYEPILTMPRTNGWGYDFAQNAGYGFEYGPEDDGLGAACFRTYTNKLIPFLYKDYSDKQIKDLYDGLKSLYSSFYDSSFYIVFTEDLNKEKEPLNTLIEYLSQRVNQMEIINENEFEI